MESVREPAQNSLPSDIQMDSRTTTGTLPVYNWDANVVVGQVVSYEPLPAPHDVCWYCSQRGDAAQLYKPCNCNSFIHRSCFREWRTGWINPRNYFSCPNCMYSYNIERVRPESPNTHERILRQYRFNVAKIWIGTLLLFGIIIAAVAVIAYYADNSNKNIPVGVKYLLSSVANGWPNSNSTTEWRDQFKSPEYRVWPYYTILAILCASVLVIFIFCAVGCSFDESQRKQRTCDTCRDCCDSNSAFVIYSAGPPPPCHPTTYSTSGTYSNSSCTCGNCNFDAFCCGGCDCGEGGCSGGSGGDCGNANCDGDAAIFLVVVLIIVVIAVILSAIVIIILFAIHKWALFYQEMNRMLANQQQELEGETMVLGINEKWRPATEV